MRRHGWWTIPCIYTESCCGRDFHLRFDKLVQKNIVGYDVSQIHLFSMCQAMPTDLHTNWRLYSEIGIFYPRQNKTKSFENMVMSYSNESDNSVNW